MPVYIKYHCVSKINTTHAFLAGGDSEGCLLIDFKNPISSKFKVLINYFRDDTSAFILDLVGKSNFEVPGGLVNKYLSVNDFRHNFNSFFSQFSDAVVLVE